MNVKHRQCARPDCATRPAFNYPGQAKGMYCNKHKETGMVNVDRKDLPTGGALRHPAVSVQNCAIVSVQEGTHACSSATACCRLACALRDLHLS